MCNEGHIKILPPCFRENEWATTLSPGKLCISTRAAGEAHRLGVQMSMEIQAHFSLLPFT